ncbi:T-cell surface glycoprotein CD8 alpha chain isoform X2 [Apodemus sylvaticus]|uniref:T-cell surface glycoprotein CD8 alpha chain isoform X2 n=1 Tax=Apodemus sylvaticus TaxID=10129 RepID=UPI0022446F62|nr:T-cell surface glycoprotein CD8 alpha chain isoform X2 [Apodemus sylvaticus]
MASRLICFLSLNLLLLDVTKLQSSGQILIAPKKVDATVGQKVNLVCEMGSTTSLGCNWLFQNSSSKLPQPIFIAYLSSTQSTVKLNDGLDLQLFSAKRDRNKYILTLKFSTKNQGYYFCTTFSNSMMSFSPLVPVFQKVNSTTTKPVPRAATPVPPAGTFRPLRPEACRPGAGGSVEGTGLDFACDIYIWAPLAGICGVLLLSLVTTLICYHRNRRRVCKCPRPLVRQGDKPRPSEKFV